jgi:hypothetical protein
VIPRLPENFANAKNGLPGGNQGWADVSWVI